MARDYKDPTTIAPVPHLNEGVMGTVATGAHPSGFNGQDAFNDRLVIDNPEDEASMDKARAIVKELTDKYPLHKNFGKDL